MSNLEKKNLEQESVKENWLGKKKMSGDLLEDLGAEGSIEQMISDIDNSRVWEILTYYLNLNENWRSREEIKKEIFIYYKDIEPRLEDEELNTLFNTLITKKRILPSWILEEFKIRDEILAEPDPKVRELMKKSLDKNRFPSLILEGKETYKKLAKIENEDERRIVAYYLENWSSTRWVEEKYEDYIYIKNYEYKNPELRSFILSLINDNGVDPSLIAYYFSIIKDRADFWEDDKEYILKLINTPWF